MPKIPSEIGGNRNNTTGNNTILGNAPKCSINTTLCADNTCQAICTKNGGNPLSNNNNSCDPGESCTSTDCAGQQSRCQNGLLCSVTAKICMTNTGTATPANIPIQVGETPGETPNCTDPTLCIQIPAIIPTSCNQCPCQFADFASDLMMGDTFKAGLRDASHTIFYTYSSPYTLE